jgi:hypothetical protein
MNKWLKLTLITVFTLGILALAWVLWRQIMTPIEYDQTLKEREKAVIGRIVDIRSAEQAFKLKNQRYTGDWDSLIDFVLGDSLTFERKLVDEDDSVAYAQLLKSGRKNVEQFVMAVRDTIFSPRNLNDQQIRDIKFIPHAEQGTEYILNAGMLTTESKVVVPVFEAKAPYKLFMHDLDQQELINLIDKAKNVYYKYPGIAVGDVSKATNDAGNWE